MDVVVGAHIRQLPNPHPEDSASSSVDDRRYPSSIDAYLAASRAFRTKGGKFREMFDATVPGLPAIICESETTHESLSILRGAAGHDDDDEEETHHQILPLQVSIAPFMGEGHDKAQFRQAVGVEGAC